MTVYFEMILIAILDTKHGSHAIVSDVPESFAAFALFQKPGVAEWQRFWSRVSGLLVGLDPPYSDMQMLWTWARYTLPFSFLSYKMGEMLPHTPFVDQESSTQYSFEHLVLVTIYVFSWRKAWYS